MPGGPPARHWPPTAVCVLRPSAPWPWPAALPSEGGLLASFRPPRDPESEAGGPHVADGVQEASAQTSGQKSRARAHPKSPRCASAQKDVSTPPSRRCCLASGTFQAILGTSTSHPTVRICTLFSSLLSPRLFTLATDWRRSLGLAGNSRIRGQKSSDRLLWPTPANPVASAPRCIWRFYSVPR